MQRLRSGLGASSDRLASLAAAIDASPARVVGALLTAHVLVWTLVPALSHAGLPLDVVEGYATGKAWVIGTYKHPALPSWLLEISRLATGVVGWPAYLVSALAIAATYGLVFVLGRDLMDARAAAAGTLALSGVLYFSWVTPEFNHNVAQMPLWVLLVLALWRARAGGGVVWWATAGLAGALGLYAKFSTALLLATAAGYILWDPQCRRQLGRPAPWLGLIVFLVAAAPLVQWLIATDYQALDYAETRAQRGKAGGVALFLFKQAASVAGSALLLGYAMIGRRGNAGAAATTLPYRAGAEPDALRFLAVFVLAPLGFATVGGLALGAGLKGAWGTSMLSLAGLLAVDVAMRAGFDVRWPRLVACTALLLVLVPVGYVGSVLLAGRFAAAPPRTSWPQADIVRRLERIWSERTGAPLRIVAGDLWIGGMVAALSPSRPSILIEGDFDRSPWLKPEDIARDGALVVWWRMPADPPLNLRPLVGTRVDGTLGFETVPAHRAAGPEIYYTILAPAPQVK